MSRRGFSSASHRNEAARVCESSSKGHLWGNSFLLQLAFQILDFFFPFSALHVKNFIFHI